MGCSWSFHTRTPLLAVTHDLVTAFGRLRVPCFTILLWHRLPEHVQLLVDRANPNLLSLLSGSLEFLGHRLAADHFRPDTLASHGLLGLRLLGSLGRLLGRLLGLLGFLLGGSSGLLGRGLGFHLGRILGLRHRQLPQQVLAYALAARSEAAARSGVTARSKVAPRSGQHQRGNELARQVGKRLLLAETKLGSQTLDNLSSRESHCHG